MSDYQLALEGYRSEIAMFEARARALREAWFSTDHEANEQEAEQFDATAWSLRTSLAEFMRHRFVASADQSDDEFASDEPSDH